LLLTRSRKYASSSSGDVNFSGTCTGRGLASSGLCDISLL
jgi:hypothetical protein